VQSIHAVSPGKITLAFPLKPEKKKFANDFYCTTLNSNRKL